MCLGHRCAALPRELVLTRFLVLGFNPLSEVQPVIGELEPRRLVRCVTGMLSFLATFLGPFWRCHSVIFRDIGVRSRKHLRDLLSDPGQDIAGLTLKNPIAGSAAQTLNNRDKTCWLSDILAIGGIGGGNRFSWVITGRHGNSPAVPPLP
jgi:hypothetical protein